MAPPIDEPLDDQERLPDRTVDAPDESHSAGHRHPDEPPRHPSIERDDGPEEIYGP